MDRTHRWLAASVAVVGVSLGLLAVRQAPEGVRIPTVAAIASERPEEPLRASRSDFGLTVGTLLPTTTVAPTTTVPPATTTTVHVHPPTTVRASRDNPSTSNQEIGRRLMLERWGEDQWRCLEGLWNRESGWRETAQNPRSGAYGIPQAYSGTRDRSGRPIPFEDRGIKMSSHGADWRTNPEVQVRWGLDYVANRYGTPCKADQVQRRTGSY